MSHVTARELSSFISRGLCSTEFERHVDECSQCAAALSAQARAAGGVARAIAGWPSVAPLIVLAACVMCVALAPHAAAPTAVFNQSAPLTLDMPGGVADAGVAEPFADFELPARASQTAAASWLAVVDAGGR